jgi:hypothetical protein
VALSAAEIDRASDLVIEEHQVPEWGGSVFLRAMSGTDRDAFEAGPRNDDGKLNMANIRARLLVKCLCDSTGKRLYEDADAVRLGNKNQVVLDRLFTAARTINKLDKADVDQLEKNSESGLTAASVSASPAS